MTELGYIEENIKKIEENINEACIKYSRDRKEIMLLPVSKTQSIKKILKLYELGYMTFGENKVQELIRKCDETPKDISWHMIGSLQTNKVKSIIGRVELIHSLDRVSLANEINKRSEQSDIITKCLIQINISNEETKSGFSINEVDGFIQKIQAYKNISIEGLMTIGSYTDDKGAIKALFNAMQAKFVDIASKKLHNINMKYLSMGMSNDYIEAIGSGANILRIGTSIFGVRE